MNLVVLDIMFVIFIVLNYVFEDSFIYLKGIMGLVVCLVIIVGNVVWIGVVLLFVIFIVIVVECYCIVISFDGSNGKFIKKKFKVRKL